MLHRNIILRILYIHILTRCGKKCLSGEPVAQNPDDDEFTILEILLKANKTIPIEEIKALLRKHENANNSSTLQPVVENRTYIVTTTRVKYATAKPNEYKMYFHRNWKNEGIGLT